MTGGSPSQGWGSPIVIPNLRGSSGGSARRRRVLPEEISALVRSHPTTAAAMQRDTSGEVSRGRSSHDGRRAESLMSGRDYRGLDERGAAEKVPRRRGAGGTRLVEHSQQQPLTAPSSNQSLSNWFPMSEKPPYTTKYGTVVWEGGAAMPLLQAHKWVTSTQKARRRLRGFFSRSFFYRRSPAFVVGRNDFFTPSHTFHTIYAHACPFTAFFVSGQTLAVNHSITIL
jgi:hypothetical protein